MALTEYDKKTLSASQQAGVAAATQKWNEANARGDAAGMAAAHAEAESIRNNAGYTSDDSGARNGYAAASSNGGTYRATSDKAKNFISGADASATMTGDDGSIWTRGGDGSVSVRSADGVTARFGGGNGGDVNAFALGTIGGAGGTPWQQSAQTDRSAELAREYQRQLEQMQQSYQRQLDALQEQQSAQQRAAEAAAEKAVGELEGKREDADRQYAALLRQLYVDKMRSIKDLDQRLAAQGVTGGAAESTVLGYDSAYEDALRQGEQERAAARGDYDRAIADARLTGDVESAKAAAESLREQQERYAEAIRDLLSRRDALLARQESNAREDAQRLERYEREDAQLRERYAREDAAAERTAARTLVQRYLDAGRMPGAELLALAGMDEATARGLLDIREEEQAAEAAAAKPKLTAAQVNAAIKAGVRTDEVLSAYEYYYGAPFRG